ncbi:MAG: translation initiation factor 1 [Kiritimatiellia bacterium]|jgi:translation initiation factor 1
MSNPFAALQGLKSRLPEGETVPVPEQAAAKADTEAPPTFATKVVVRAEKKGRGGKVVTRITGVMLRGEALDSFSRTLRKQLGTGGSVDGHDILIAGKQIDRVVALLEKAGAKRVIRG